MLEKGNKLLQSFIEKYNDLGIKLLFQFGRWYFLQKSLSSIYDCQFVNRRWMYDLCTTTRYYLQKRRYRAPANPYKLIWVEPADINYSVRYIPTLWGLGQIHSGDWDRKKNLFKMENHVTYIGLQQRFNQGYDWEDTIYYKQAKRHFDSRSSSTLNGCSNIDDFKEIQCMYVDSLFKDIRENGYQPNFSSDSTTLELEPEVAIGRDGEIYWRSGFHRWSIAKILDISPIPVNVVCRHQDFQLIRDDFDTHMSKSGEDSKSCVQNYKHHPDIQEFINLNQDFT